MDEIKKTSLVISEQSMVEVEKNIRDFLEFRKKFTKRQWLELNTSIDARLKEKADQLELDDSDIQIISECIKSII